MRTKNKLIHDNLCKRGRRAPVILFAICFSLLWTQTACNAIDETLQASPTDLAELSIEQLMDIQVTSVSRKAESLYNSAAAVYVVTQEDIRRSGATSIPEALRMVPGLQVAKTNGNTWVITSRGFADRWASKLLVLIDGRNVYTPLFSGVYWDVQDYMLEDIDRIEVIRGPGATMWGANAVNGIINIITKSAGDTTGGLAVGGAGREERAFGGVRCGDALGENGSYRVYAKYFSRDDTGYRKWNPTDPTKAGDSWHQSRGGFRCDWNLNKNKSLTIQGDIYDGGERQILEAYYLTVPFRQNTPNRIAVSGGNLLARLTDRVSETSEQTLQFYYDRIDRRELEFGEHRNTWDLDFQRRQRPNARHELIWGLGYRYTVDSTDSSFWVNFDPAEANQTVFSAFIQDDIILKPNKVRLTLGSKFEHNSYTNIEIQPNIRALWTPSKRNAIWAAISRAVRTPSRWERSGRVNAEAAGNPALPSWVVVTPNPEFVSEKLTAYELGYRTQPSKRVSFDLAAFYNVYDDIRAFAGVDPFLEMSPLPPHIVLPLQLQNKISGTTRGAELAINWEPTDWWRLSGGVSYLHMDLIQDPSTLANWLTEPILDPMDGSPKRQYHIRSYIDLPNNLEFDAMLYSVGAVERTIVPAYSRVDLRLGWRPRKDFDVSLILQNAFQVEHREFDVGLDEKQTMLQHSLFTKVTWGF